MRPRASSGFCWVFACRGGNVGWGWCSGRPRKLKWVGGEGRPEVAEAVGEEVILADGLGHRRCRDAGFAGERLRVCSANSFGGRLG